MLRHHDTIVFRDRLAGQVRRPRIQLAPSALVLRMTVGHVYPFHRRLRSQTPACSLRRYRRKHSASLMTCFNTTPF